SGGAAGAALLRRQQGAAVRDRRRPCRNIRNIPGLVPVGQRRQMGRCAAQNGRQYHEEEAVAQYPTVTARRPSTPAAASNASSARSQVMRASSILSRSATPFFMATSERSRAPRLVHLQRLRRCVLRHTDGILSWLELK